MPGNELFQYLDEKNNVHKVSSEDVNGYIKQHCGGDFTAKDFRTWGGTLIAAILLLKKRDAHTPAERKECVTNCIKHVARKSGNTPANARKGYIDPTILETDMGNANFAKLEKAMHSMKTHRYMKP